MLQLEAKDHARCGELRGRARGCNGFAADGVIACQAHDARQRAGLHVIARQLKATIGHRPVGIDRRCRGLAAA